MRAGITNLTVETSSTSVLQISAQMSLQHLAQIEFGNSDFRFRIYMKNGSWRYIICHVC
jgi:hypothetical protein